MISQLHFASMNALFKLSFVENQSQHRAPIVYIGSWCLFSAAATIDPLKKLRRWGCAYIHVYVHFKAQRFRRQKGHLLASDKSLHRNYTKNAHFFWSTQWFYFKTSKKGGKSLFFEVFSSPRGNSMCLLYKSVLEEICLESWNYFSKKWYNFLQGFFCFKIWSSRQEILATPDLSNFIFIFWYFQRFCQIDILEGQVLTFSKVSMLHIFKRNE